MEQTNRMKAPRRRLLTLKRRTLVLLAAAMGFASCNDSWDVEVMYGVPMDTVPAQSSQGAVAIDNPAVQ